MSTNQLVPDSSTFEISSNAMNLANLGVTGGKIADTTITGGKLANGAVTSAKLAFPITGGGAGSYIQARDKTTVYNNNFNSSSFIPVASSKTVNGVWSMGTIGWNDDLYFCYTTDANYSSSTNAAQSITISPNGNNNLIPNMSKCATYTTTDPGKNSALADGKFVFVYEN